ncbi:MAG: CbtA family protein [Rhizobiales bacterium]|nr:CbtA family protein [Hyphomicrobiales bacterium]
MVGRVVLAALLAGIAAGILMGGIQQVRITPLILQAEKYETAMLVPQATAAEQGAGAIEPAAENRAWEPSKGLERALFTTLASAVTGAGFAALLAGVSLLTGIPITPRNGVIWGLCGFIALTLAPSAGLPPALPGVPAGDLVFRQIWWTATVLATGAALYLIATHRTFWPIAAAVALIAAPHFVALPQPADPTSAVPPILAAVYVSNVLAAAAVFWSLIGAFLGVALQKFSKDILAT